METLQSIPCPEDTVTKEGQTPRSIISSPEIALGIMIGVMVCFALALGISLLIIISQDAIIHDLLLNHSK